MLQPGSGEGRRAGGVQAGFVVTLFSAALFTAFFVATDDLYSLGGAVPLFVAYLAAGVISFRLLLRRRLVLPFVVVSLLALGLAWIIGGSGYPVSSATVSYTSTCTTFTNGTSGLVQNICGAQPHPGQDYPLAFAEDFVAWAPLVGCLLYAAPGDGKVLGYGNLGRMVRGAVPSAAIMFSLLGVRSTGGFNSPIAGIGPVNPFIAFRECDSTTAINGCDFSSPAYLLTDYLFWLALGLLLAVLVGEAYRLGRRNEGHGELVGHDPRAKWVAVVLAALVIAGGTVVPLALTQGGAIVTSGYTFSFSPGDFIDIPFAAAHASTLTGSFSSSTPVDVYLLNSTQFSSFHLNGNYYCPMAGTSPVLSNATRGALDVQAVSGSDHLVFCVSFAFRNAAAITIQTTSAVRIAA